MIIIIVKLLDPLMLVIAALITLAARRWWHVLVVGFVVALISETILNSTQILRVWGEGLVPGFIAYSIHSALAFWAIRKWRCRRREPVAPADQLASGEASTPSSKP